MKISNVYNQLIKESKNLKSISLETAIKLSQLSDIKDVGQWLITPIDKLHFFYAEEPIEMFSSQIEEMESTYDEFPEDLVRTEKIYELLKNGNKPMPIFIEFEDVAKFIMEGRHRIVAFKWFGLKIIPVIYVK